MLSLFHRVWVPVYAKTFGLSLYLVCSLTLVSTPIQWYLMFHSVRQVFGCLLHTSWHKNLQHIVVFHVLF